MLTEAKKKAIKRYKAKVKHFTLDFSPADIDLLEHINKQTRKQTYIKNLIRADMCNGKIGAP